MAHIVKRMNPSSARAPNTMPGIREGTTFCGRAGWAGGRAGGWAGVRRAGVGGRRPGWWALAVSPAPCVAAGSRQSINRSSCGIKKSVAAAINQSINGKLCEAMAARSQWQRAYVINVVASIRQVEGRPAAGELRPKRGLICGRNSSMGICVCVEGTACNGLQPLASQASPPTPALCPLVSSRGWAAALPTHHSRNMCPNRVR